MPPDLQQPRFELQTRAAVKPKSLDMEARTVEVVVSRGGGKPVWLTGLGRAVESLEISQRAIDLKRLKAAGPVLDGHMGWSTRSQLGSVQDAWIGTDGGKPALIARLHFRDTEVAQEALEGIQSGDVRNVSVGYKVLEYRQTSKPDAAKHEVLATKWEPWEVSLTPLPAEALAGVRSSDAGDAPAPVVIPYGRQATSMDEEEENGGGGEATPNDLNTRGGTATQDPPAQGADTGGSAGDPPAAPEGLQTRSGQGQGGDSTPTPTPQPEPTDDLLVRGQREERQRQQQIRELTDRYGLGGSDIEQRLVRDGTDFQEARIQVHDHLLQRDEQLHGRRNVHVGQTEGQKVAGGLEEALSRRCGLSEGDLSDAGRIFGGMTMLESARELLTRSGVSLQGMDRVQIAGQALMTRDAHSSADFPGILANVLNKAVRKGYTETPQRWRAFGRSGTVSDFKEARRIQLGAVGTPSKLPEGANIRFTTMGEAFERIKADTYGSGISVTRVMLINDDMDMFTRTAPYLGNSARRLLDISAFTLLVSNPTMEDGEDLFSAAHNNVVTSAPLDIAGFQKAYTALRKQRGIAPGNGEQGALLDLMANGVLIPVELKGAAHQLLVATTAPTTIEEANPWGGMIQAANVIDSPRLESADFWYLMASQSEIDLLEVAFLNGREEPQIEQERDFDSKSIRFSLIHDWGMSFLDHRGLVRAKVTA